MQKLIVILLIATLFIGCKKDTKSPSSVVESEEVNSDREISGSFFYFEDSAVLQTNRELFGVIINEKSQELIKRTKPLKDAPTDEVAVTLKVKVTKKPEHEEGWENRVEIIDIINVSKVDQKDSDIIKLRTEE